MPTSRARLGQVDFATTFGLQAFDTVATFSYDHGHHVVRHSNLDCGRPDMLTSNSRSHNVFLDIGFFVRALDVGFCGQAQEAWRHQHKLVHGELNLIKGQHGGGSQFSHPHSGVLCLLGLANGLTTNLQYSSFIQNGPSTTLTWQPV